MYQDHFDAVYNEISELEITRESKGFTVRMGPQTVTLPEATNFEFRPGSPMMVKHIYLGSEDGKGCRCHITFLRPRRVRSSGAVPRCYMYID
jgi:hypothetical protein